MAATRRTLMTFACWATMLAVGVIVQRVRADEVPGALRPFANSTGAVRTSTTRQSLDGDNPFFQDLGTNGRRCVSCHQPSDAWTITPAHVQVRFDASNGTDPIFTNNDGSNCEGAQPDSAADERAAYSLLLTRGLIRIGLDVPADAEFVIEAVDDPYHCAPGTNDISVYRRPLPSTNLRFLSAVMWDGRESLPTRTIPGDLAHQANSATRGHAQAARDLTDSEAQAIVAFETELFTAQDHDTGAGNLHARRARGGPGALSEQPFFIGINDPVGLNPAGTRFDPNVFTLFSPWSAIVDDDHAEDDDAEDAARRAIVRGQNTFNTRTFTISDVAGLNGQTFPNGFTVPASFTGTCTICHDTPNAGDHSEKAPLYIGVADPTRASYLPIYRLRNIHTGDVVSTTDPGRAMITGRWTDIGKFKGPVLRALAARPPYFHNGSAGTLEQVVDFYDTRFQMGLTAQEKADLVAFLRAL
jgi:cytochrome c peroxidase